MVCDKDSSISNLTRLDRATMLKKSNGILRKCHSCQGRGAVCIHERRYKSPSQIFWGLLDFSVIQNIFFLELYDQAYIPPIIRNLISVSILDRLGYSLLLELKS